MNLPVHKQGLQERDWRSRISINPEVCFGRPCIKGTRIGFLSIVDNLAEGVSEAELLEAMQLVPEDIVSARLRGGNDPGAVRRHSHGNGQRMKLKLDENIDVRLAPIMAAAGHDVDTVKAEGLSGEPDETIYETCRGMGESS